MILIHSLSSWRLGALGVLARNFAPRRQERQDAKEEKKKYFGLKWVALMSFAVAGCASSKPKTVTPHDAKLDLYNATARLEFDDGRPAEAADAYALALDRATVIDDPAACAAVAYSLAITRAASYDYAGALAALDIAAYDAHRARIDPTDLLLVRSRVELLNNNTIEALRAADQVLAETRSKPTPLRRAQAHVLKGLCDCRGGDAAGAFTEWEKARSLAGNSPSASMTAMLYGLSGEINLLKKMFQLAATDFDAQASESMRAADFRTMCRALAKAGRAYGSHGDPINAADRLYRAARAAVAGDSRDAAALVAEATAAADKSRDQQLIDLTYALKLHLRRP